MKTDALIAMLARGPVAADARTTERRLAAAALLGALVAEACALATFGLRHDIAAAVPLPAFWLKIAFPATLAAAAAAFAATCLLARPGAALGGLRCALIAPLVVVWAVAGWALIDPPAGERMALVTGHSAFARVASVALLALPGFVAAFAALRALAPTRPRAARACAGLLAGALAATLYAFHCDEMEAPFVAVWYVLGMLLPTALGAVLGPRLLCRA